MTTPTLDEIKKNLLERGIGYHDFAHNRLPAPVESFSWITYGELDTFREYSAEEYPGTGHLIFLFGNLTILHFAKLEDICFHFNI